MNEFWAQLVASLIGALTGGLLAAATAAAVFRGERRERNSERELAAAGSKKQRDRETIAELYTLMEQLLAALLPGESQNQSVLAGHRFGMVASRLALDMTPDTREGFYGWLNSFVERYLAAGQAAFASGLDQDFRVVTGLLQLGQSRFEMWFTNESEDSEWALSDHAFRELHPSVDEPSTHPDRPA